MLPPGIALDIAHDHHRILIRRAAAQRRHYLAQIVQVDRLVRFYRHLALAVGGLLSTLASGI